MLRLIENLKVINYSFMSCLKSSQSSRTLMKKADLYSANAIQSLANHDVKVNITQRISTNIHSELVSKF